MYHMTEDRENEASMEPDEEREGTSRAEDLSSNSYCDALNEYREKAETGLLFENAFPGEDSISYGEKLADRLRILEQELRYGIVPAEWLTPDEHTMAYDALLLPFGFYYNEYTYVGDGGNAQFPRDSEDFGKFDEETQWEECDETDIRNKLVEAIYHYCVSAAAFAKHLEAKPEMQKLMKAMALIELNCRDGHDGDGGMSKKDAKLVCLWIEDATRSLWAYSTVQARFIKLGFAASANGAKTTPQPQNDVPELTPEQKRSDDLLAAGMAGFITEDEDRELRVIMAQKDKTYIDHDQPTEAAEGALPPIDITPNAYYQQFLRVDPVKCTVSITDEQGVVKTFTIPRTFDKAWQILKWILETDDIQDGWFKFEGDKFKDYYATNWRQQFLHGENRTEMLVFLRYAWSLYGAGRHEGPTTIRFRPKLKPDPPRGKKSKKSKAKKTQVKKNG